MACSCDGVIQSVSSPFGENIGIYGFNPVEEVPEPMGIISVVALFAGVVGISYLITNKDKRKKSRRYHR
jgi:hypothetical protein